MKKKIPYGESSYKEVIDNNMYYVDKTKYIELLELMPRYQFFIRPRRFGKSLFLSMLETYYNVLEEGNFDKYFGDKYIGKNKTKEANNYLVLKLSFAEIITDQGKDMIIKTFDQIVRSAVNLFASKYDKYIDFDKDEIKEENAINILMILKERLAINNQTMIVLIDEYDNFANGLMLKNEELYKNIVQTDGYVKTFYKGIKEGTREGVISRVFITGVSPILLDDLTSGANIFSNISNKKMLNSMMGITQEELEEMIGYYELEKYENKDEMLKLMKELYDGYKFNEETEETIYNTGMILYIVNNIQLEMKYPKEMLDNNIKTDYGKIRIIAQNFESRDELREIIEENRLIGPIEIKSRFGLETLKDDHQKEENFSSLLYYLGLVTIKKTEGRNVYLGIPNYSVKTMYWEYLYTKYKISSIKRMQDIKEAMGKMRKQADVKDIMEIYKEVRLEISNRDLKAYNEMTSKAIFISLVFVDDTYMMQSEKEVKSGWTDLYLKEGVTYKEEVKYRYLLEFKHIKEKDYTEELLEKKKQEAKEQLKKYIDDNKLYEDSEKPLKKMIVVTIGKREVVYEEI